MVQLYPNQQKLVDEILQHSKEYDTHIIGAPTGSGKSLIALFLTDGLGGGYGTTPYRTLVNQYERELTTKFEGENLGAPVMGRGAYPCPYLQQKEKPVFNATADGAPCTSKNSIYDYHGKQTKKCPLLDVCPYYAAVAKAKASKTCVSTLHYLLYAIVNKISADDGIGNTDSEWNRRPVLFVDEAHNLPAIMTDFFKVEVTKKSFPGFDYDALYNRIANEHLTSEQGLESFQSMFDVYFAEQTRELDTMEAKFAEYQMDNFIRLEDADGRLVDPQDYEKLIVKQRKLVYRLKFIRTTLANEDVEWLFYMNSDGMYWKPYSPAPFLQEIWGKFEHLVFMSATMFNIPLYIKQLGLETRKTQYIEMPSSFDPKKGKIYFNSNLYLNRDNFDQTIGQVVSEIENIARKYPNESGMIHAFSRKYKDEIWKRVAPDVKDRMVTHESGDRMEKLEEFTNSPKGTIFLTMNMAEGVDLNGDLGRWQIIVKAPLPSIGDPYIAAHMRREPGWYDTLMIMSVLQMCGRVVRSKEDWGDTYIIDQVIASKLKKNWNMLQSHIKDRIRAGMDAEMESLNL